MKRPILTLNHISGSVHSNNYFLLIFFSEFPTSQLVYNELTSLRTVCSRIFLQYRTFNAVILNIF